MLDIKRSSFVLSLLLAILFGSNCKVLSQGVFLRPSLRYTVGDAISDLEFDNIVNFSTSKARLKDFRGKIVILDFWALWCGPCVSALPKLDSIQRRFSDKIQIIPVDGIGRGDNAKTVREYFLRKGFILPSIVEDTILDRVFPHRVIPHDVWIDQTGNVIATTDAEQLTDKNIESCLNGNYTTLKLKRDDLSFNIDLPLFVKGNVGRCDSFLSRSLLTRYISSIPSTYRQSVHRLGGGIVLKSIQGTNITMLDYYSQVLSMGRKSTVVNPNFIRIHKGDSVYNPWTVRDPGSPWYDSSNLYCYSYDIANDITDSLFYRDLVLTDLNRVFNCKGRIVKVPMPCIGFRIADSSILKKRIANSNILQRIRYSDVEHSVVDSAVGMPFDNLINFLSSYYHSSVPLIDLSGLGDTRITFELGIDYNINRAYAKPINFEKWKDAFEKNGISLSFISEEIEIVDLVIN